MIRLIDAEKVYDNGTRALKGVSFTVDDGEFVFLVGPSGSGKSTIIKLMTGEVVPTAGRVMVNGFSMSRIAEKQIPYMRRTIGVIFQDFRLIGANDNRAPRGEMFALDPGQTAFGVANFDPALKADHDFHRGISMDNEEFDAALRGRVVKNGRRIHRAILDGENRQGDTGREEKQCEQRSLHDGSPW